MPRPRPDTARTAVLYALDLTLASRIGGSGSRIGQGVGASLEFQDRRSYVAGDNLRHLDWRAYARTDQLLVRLYREEIYPRVEVLIDGSRSMASDPDKAQTAVDLAHLLAQVGRSSGCSVKLLWLGDPPRPLEADAFEQVGVEFTAAGELADTARVATGLLRTGALRILLSDLLVPQAPASVLRPLATRAGAMVVLQLLSREDADPAAGGALRMVDAETDAFVDLVVDDRCVRLYRDRLRRLTDAFEEETRRLAGRFVTLHAARGLETICREELCRSGVIVPA
jgi:uncharacterized protein (DUF58 family)